MSIQPKKILYVITKSNFGGAQRYVYDLATGLSDYNLSPVTYNLSPVVALGGTGERGAGTGKLNEMLQKAGVRTIVLKHASRNMHVISDILLFFELLALFKKERPDVIHLNSSKVAGLGALAARLSSPFSLLKTTRPNVRPARPFGRGHSSGRDNYQLKTIFTVHGFAFAEDRPLLARICIRFLSWLTVALASRTILITNAEYEKVRHWPCVGHKAFLIHNGIAPIPFLDKTTARRALSEKIQDSRFKIQDSSFLIGTIAELHKNKGLAYLIEAISFLNLQPTRPTMPSGRTSYPSERPGRAGNLQAIIIGEGEERVALQKLIAAQGLRDTVFLVGFVKNAAQYLKAFDLFILPSLKEGFPYALLEAGAAQLPVVATSVGGVPEYLTHEKNGLLVSPGNTEELAQALAKLLDDTEKRDRFGTNAAKTVHSSFAMENMLKKTTALYKNMLY